VTTPTPTTTPAPTTAERRKQHVAALRSWQRDPAAFRAALLIDADAGPVRLGEVLDDWQRADFAALDPAWQHVAHRTGNPQFRRAWLERPRGHAKTSDLAAMITWVLFASPRRLTGLAAAADKDQAKLLRDAVSKLVAMNPWLAEYLDVQAFKVVNRHTESTLEVISSDVPSSWGVTPDFIAADEVTHWRSDEMWNSLTSSAAKRSHCLMLCIANAGVQTDWQWQRRESIRQDPAWYFHALDGPQASWITQDRLEQQRRDLPPFAYQRYWLNRWGAGAGDALDPDAIRCAVVQRIPEPQRTWAFYGGLDLGHVRDACGFVVVAKSVGCEVRTQVAAPRMSRLQEAMVDLGWAAAPVQEPTTEWREGDGRLTVAQIQIWKPTPGRPVDFDAVEQAVRIAHEKFRFGWIWVDPWQAVAMLQRLAKIGVPSGKLDFTPANTQRMATVTLDAFRDRNITIPSLQPGADDLVADLHQLKYVERQQGFKLTSDRHNRDEGTRHGDSATALQLALTAASDFGGGAGSRVCRIEGPLLCWP